MSDEKLTTYEDITIKYHTEQPTLELRWYQPPGNPLKVKPAPVLQQAWLITEYGPSGSGQRTEWRDVPTVTP